MNNQPMSNTTPRTDIVESGVNYEGDGTSESMLADMTDFARQLETELASVQLELGTTKCELVESTKREAQLREALRSIDLSPCDGGSCEVATMADELIQAALSQPAPPVVPLADVKPILDAVNRLPKCDNHSTTEHKAACARCLLHKSLAAFTAKHPQS